MKKATTSERLNELMNKKGIKQIDILKLVEPYCKKYNIKLNSNDLSQYVTGKVEPRQNKVSVLSDALNINPAWLMGYDVPMDKNEEEMRANFSLALFELLKYCQLDRKKLGELIGVSEKRVNEFVHQLALPTENEIDKIVDIFSLNSKYELFDGTAIKRIIEKYKQDGYKLIDKFNFGFEFEDMLTKLSIELDIPLEKIKSIVFDRDNDLTMFVTYDDLYDFLKKYFKENIEID